MGVGGVGGGRVHHQIMSSRLKQTEVCFNRRWGGQQNESSFPYVIFFVAFRPANPSRTTTTTGTFLYLHCCCQCRTLPKWCRECRV